MHVDIQDIKRLREETQASVADCRQALLEAAGDVEKAKKLLRERGLEKAAKKEGKETSQGVVEAYVHNGKVGVLLELRCETDFVARTDEFRYLAHELALQVCSMNPKDVAELVKSPYIRDPNTTVADFMKQTIALLGENITVARFTRVVLGE